MKLSLSANEILAGSMSPRCLPAPSMTSGMSTPRPASDRAMAKTMVASCTSRNSSPGQQPGSVTGRIEAVAKTYIPSKVADHHETHVQARAQSNERRSRHCDCGGENPRPRIFRGVGRERRRSRVRHVETEWDLAGLGMITSPDVAVRRGGGASSRIGRIICCSKLRMRVR